MAKILVVDDERDLRNLVAMVLSGQGHEVESAIDGREGLDKIGSFQPDLVVLDLMMPEVDGWGVLAALREKQAAAPRVILLSAYANDAATQRRGVEAGAWACLGKPFRLPELLGTCTRALAP